MLDLTVELYDGAVTTVLVTDVDWTIDDVYLYVINGELTYVLGQDDPEEAGHCVGKFDVDGTREELNEFLEL